MDVPITHRDTDTAALPATGNPCKTNAADTTAHYPAEAFATSGDRHFAALSATPDSDATRYAHDPANATGNSYTTGSWHSYGCAYITGAAAAWPKGSIWRN